MLYWCRPDLAWTVICHHFGGIIAPLDPLVIEDHSSPSSVQALDAAAPVVEHQACASSHVPAAPNLGSLLRGGTSSTQTSNSPVVNNINERTQGKHSQSPAHASSPMTSTMHEMALSFITDQLHQASMFSFIVFHHQLTIVRSQGIPPKSTQQHMSSSQHKHHSHSYSSIPQTPLQLTAVT